MAQEIVLTAEAYKAKYEELEYLRTTGRDEIAERIKEARSFGDLSENSEYDEALNDQAKLEEKIAQLEAVIKNAKILDENDLSTELIHVGSRVRVRSIDKDCEYEYKILGESQSDPAKGIISDRSPVGGGLLGKKVGDIAKIKLPSGKEASYEILEILK